MLDFEKLKVAFKDMSAARVMKFVGSGLLSTEEMVALLGLVAFLPRLVDEIGKLRKGFAKFDMARIEKLRASGMLNAAEFEAIEGILEMIQAVRAQGTGTTSVSSTTTNGVTVTKSENTETRT